MDSVEFNGVTYVRAAVVAKQFSYTQDYIGQLCRGKKVDARRVGRSWFVNPDSIQMHKDQKRSDLGVYTDSSEKTQRTVPVDGTSQSQSQDPDVACRIKTERKVVSPAPRAELYESPVPLEKIELPIATQLEVKYEPDEESLIPHLHRQKNPPVASIPVNPAQAKKVKIKTKRAPEINFEAEDLPSIALSGRVAVKDIPLEPIDLMAAEEEQVRAKNAATSQPSDPNDFAETKSSSVPRRPHVHRISVNRDMLKNKGKMNVINGHEPLSSHNPTPFQKLVVADSNTTTNPSLQKNTVVVTTTSEATTSAFGKKLHAVSEQKSDHLFPVAPSPSPSEGKHIASQHQVKMQQEGGVDQTQITFSPKLLAHKKVVAVQPISLAVPVAVCVAAVFAAFWVLFAGSLIEVSESGYQASVILISPDIHF